MVKCRLAACFHVHRAITASSTIYEVTEWLSRIKSFPNEPPLVRLGFQVKSVIPACCSNSSFRGRTKSILGQSGEIVVRINLPNPVGRGFGIVTKPAFAFAHCCLGTHSFGQIENEADSITATFFEQRATNEHGNAATVFSQILLLEG